MGTNAITTAPVLINNINFPIVPNTLKFTDGFGEYTQRASSSGKGQTDVVFSENAENKKSKVMFEMFPTAANIEAIRQWKANTNNNVIEIATDELQRSFTSAALVNDPENALGADTTISLEWECDPAS